MTCCAILKPRGTAFITFLLARSLRGRTEFAAFGIGRFNTEAEVDYVADRVIETVERLRELSPLYEMAKEGINLKDVKWAGE